MDLPGAADVAVPGCCSPRTGEVQCDVQLRVAAVEVGNDEITGWWDVGETGTVRADQPGRHQVRGLRWYRQRNPVVVDRGVRASLDVKNLVDGIRRHQEAVHAELLVLAEQVRKVDLHADNQPEPEAVDGGRPDARGVEAGDLGVFTDRNRRTRAATCAFT